MKNPRAILLVFLSLLTAPLAAQYQTDPTHLYPASSNTSPSKKTPPKNKVVSTVDKQRAGINLRKADKFYPLNREATPIPLNNGRKQAPPTVWKNAKKPKYQSLYQDPSTIK